MVPLKFLIVYLSTLLCFWTQNYLGVMWARTAVTALLSGALVPLAFLPHWLQTVAAVLPFAGLTATPASILLGRSEGWAAIGLLAVQAAWIVGLWLFGLLAWRAAVRQLTVHGG